MKVVLLILMIKLYQHIQRNVNKISTLKKEDIVINKNYKKTNLTFEGITSKKEDKQIKESKLKGEDKVNYGITISGNPK